MPDLLPIHFAPLQGYTDAVYRQAHARIFGGIDTYYTPFVRVEHGEIRRKDIRELEPENNRNVPLVPQLIAPDTEKLEQIMSLFIAKGFTCADINLGCPFPLLAKRHNGSGMLPYPDEVRQLLEFAVSRYPQVRFSVKMRLGWENPEESLALLPLLNELPLSHIILHPRLGKQQYKGSVDLAAFEAFYNGCRHPLFYNGDLLTVADIQSVALRFPDWRVSSSAAACWPIRPWQPNTGKASPFLPMKRAKNCAASMPSSSANTAICCKAATCNCSTR